MFSALLTLALALEGVGDVLNSANVVPVAGTFMILGIVVAGIWSGVRNREMRSQERLAAIAKGIPIEPTWDEAMMRNATQPCAAPQGFARPNDGAGARRAGIVLVSAGIGLIGFFAALAAILRQRDVLSGTAIGIIPVAIGIGFLIDARLRKAEFDRVFDATRQDSSSAPTSTPEFRPLH